MSKVKQDFVADDDAEELRFKSLMSKVKHVDIYKADKSYYSSAEFQISNE